MNKYIKTIAVLFLISGIAACSSSPEIVEEKEEEPMEKPGEFDAMAKRLLGDEAIAEACSSGEFVLVSKVTPANQYNPNDVVSFSIVMVADESVVYERKDYFGSVEWFDDHRLELTPAVGIVKADDNPASRFRLLLNAKTGLMEETQVSR